MDAGENTINSNEKQDVMIYIRFVRGHWKIYIVAVLLTVVVSMIYGLFFKEKAYESTAGLYYRKRSIGGTLVDLPIFLDN